MQKNCQTCRFGYTDSDLQGHGAAAAKGPNNGEVQNHECRYNPPTSSEGFPLVMNLWWCGKWECKGE